MPLPFMPVGFGGNGYGYGFSEECSVFGSGTGSGYHWFSDRNENASFQQEGYGVPFNNGHGCGDVAFASSENGWEGGIGCGLNTVTASVYMRLRAIFEGNER